MIFLRYYKTVILTNENVVICRQFTIKTLFQLFFHSLRIKVGLTFIRINESHLKITNVFFFILKAVLVLKIFEFLS